MCGGRVRSVGRSGNGLVGGRVGWGWVERVGVKGRRGVGGREDVRDCTNKGRTISPLIRREGQGREVKGLTIMTRVHVPDVANDGVEVVPNGIDDDVCVLSSLNGRVGNGDGCADSSGRKEGCEVELFWEGEVGVDLLKVW
jgi:hypothetical protein